MRNLKIIFMGTPDFAIPSLDILVKHGYNIVAVVTAPDKPRGRGQKLTPSPVKKYATEHQIPVLQPTNLKAPDFLDQLKNIGVNLQVVVAFRMLPEKVWSYPAYGTFNLHASLLPQYRGAAPINWAIMNGETFTGATTFMIKHEIDTGSIIYQEKAQIKDEDDAGALHDRLMITGAELVLKTVQAIEQDKVELKPQTETGDLKKAPKIHKDTCKIQWDQPVRQVYNFIRGLAPYPAAWTEHEGKILKIYRTTFVEEPPEQAPGSINSDQKNFLHIAASDGWIQVKELQVQGKKRMQTEEFLRGNKI